jgi:UDPglucose 6-dehydrogenase
MITPEIIEAGPASIPALLQVLALGSGFVGQAEGKALAGHGHGVVFTDVEPRVLARLRAEGWPAIRIEDLELTETDVVLIAVPTPNADGATDLGPIRSAATTIGAALGRAWATDPRRYRVAIVRSTVPPGTTEGVVIPLLEAASGLRVGRDVGVCVMPEYLRRRTATADSVAPRLIVLGASDERAADVAGRLHAGFACPVHRLSIRDAEFHKYAHNLTNAAKVAFFNELRRVARAAGVDAERVFAVLADSAESSWNAEYGLRDLGPFAGPCLPKDLEAFLAWSGDLGEPVPILAAVRRSNGTRDASC